MKRATGALFLTLAPLAAQQVAVRGETVYTMAGPPLRDGVVLMRDGKIERVGPAASTPVPPGATLLSAKVVTPGLIDAHTVAGLTGYLNQAHDQEQVERSAPMQPELRAIDAYDSSERLVEYLRSLGVTSLHTGHGPGVLMSGQTMIVKTIPGAVLQPAAMIAATFGDGAKGERQPGTRGRMMAMLRGELIKAQEYAKKMANADETKRPARDLRMDALAALLKGEMPLLVTVHRAQDIATALRVGKEFGLKLVLDGVADAPLMLSEIKQSGYPVIVHPTMFRSGGETENLSLETASKLRAAGIPFALQSGFEGYVPKTRVVLFEAGVAAANGLTFEQALASITIDAAKLLGIDRRVGSLEAGKDGDVALYDGDPFEYATHCTGVVVDGRVR
ncbi:MAG: amidohydrolase family protein [Bryobacterales bacterium]|nr:amidohydrolase family protein [Bryobacterales bacterium]